MPPPLLSGVRVCVFDGSAPLAAQAPSWSSRCTRAVRQLFGLDDVTKKVDTVECSADRLQELIDSCDTKTKAQIAEGMDFLKVKGFEPEAAEAQVNAL